MEQYQFVIVVLPDLSPKCVVYSKSSGLNYKDLFKSINEKNISNDFDLYSVTPSWIEKISVLKNMKFSDEFMKDFPNYRLQFYPRAYPQYIFRFKPVAKEKEIEIHKWNAAIDSGSNVQLDDFLKAFSKTFFIEATELKFEFKDSSIKLDLPILSQIELFKKNEIELTFSITDNEFSHAKKRIDVLKEIRTSEERYVADLQKITENFTEKIFIKYHIDSDVYRRTFKSVSDILPIHSSFLKSLQKIGAALETSIGPLFLEFIPYFKVAAPHVANFSSVIEEITDLVETNRSFGKEIFQICRSEFKGNTVESLLVTPVQRIPRYPLLLKELLKCVPNCHWDKDDIQLSFNNLTKLNLEIDQKTSEQKSANAMAQLQKKFGNSYKVLTGGRYIISTINSEESSLYLFNDLLLIQLKHEDSYKYKEFPLITTKVLKGKTDFTFSTKKNVFSYPVTDESQTFVESFSKTKRDFLLKKCTFDGSLRWSSKPCKGPPELKSAAIASILLDLYLFGGKNKEDGTVSNDLWWFHKDEWELVEVTNAPKPRYDCTMSVYGTSLVVFGGHDNDNNIFDDLLVFDIPTANWIVIDSKSNMKPTPRFAHAAAFLGSQLWIYGGKSRDTYFNDLYCFDFDYNDWWKITTPKTPEPRAWSTAFWIPEKILKTKRSKENATNLEEEEPNVNDDDKNVSECGANFAIFGGVYKSATYRTIWMFDYDNVDWVEIETQGDQPTARFSHVSAQFNNALYIIGGRSMQDNSLDPYRLDMTTKPYTWSVLPQSDEPNSFDNGACCVIDDFGLALYNTTLYFIKFKQDYKNPEPVISTNEDAMTKNKFEGTRLSRPIYNIESNVVTTYIDHPRSTFDFGYQFSENKIDSIMKRAENGSVKWKDDSVIITGSILLDESFFINEDDGLQKLLPPNSEMSTNQPYAKIRTSTNIPFFAQNKKPKSTDHMYQPRKIKTMYERSSFNPSADQQPERPGIIKRDSIPSSASVELQYSSRNSMFNKDTSQMNFDTNKQDEKSLKQSKDELNLGDKRVKTDSNIPKIPPIIKPDHESNSNQQKNPNDSTINQSPEKMQPNLQSPSSNQESNTSTLQHPQQTKPALPIPQSKAASTSQLNQMIHTKTQENPISPNPQPNKASTTQTNPPIPTKSQTNPSSPSQSTSPPIASQIQPNPATKPPVNQQPNPATKPQNTTSTVQNPASSSPQKQQVNAPTVSNQQPNQTVTKPPANSTAPSNSQSNPAAKPPTSTISKPQQNPPPPTTTTSNATKPQTNQQSNTTPVQKPPVNSTAVPKIQINQQTNSTAKPQTNQPANNTATKTQANQPTNSTTKPQTNQPANATTTKPQINQPANVTTKPQTNQPTNNTATKPQTNQPTNSTTKPQTNQTQNLNAPTKPPINSTAVPKSQTNQPANATTKPQTNQPANNTIKPQTSQQLNAAATKPQTSVKPPLNSGVTKPPVNQTATKTQPNTTNTTANPQQNTAYTNKTQTNQPIKQQPTSAPKPASQTQNQTAKPQLNQSATANKTQQNQNAAIKPQQNQNAAANKPQQNQTTVANKPQQNQNATVNKPQQTQQASTKPQQNVTSSSKPQTNQTAATNKPQQNPASKPNTNTQAKTPQQNSTAPTNKQQQNATTPANKPQQTNPPPKPQQNSTAATNKTQPNPQTQRTQQNSATQPQKVQTANKPIQNTTAAARQQQNTANKPIQNPAASKQQTNQTTRIQQNQTASQNKQQTNTTANATTATAKAQQNNQQTASKPQPNQQPKPQQNQPNKTQANPPPKTQQNQTTASKPTQNSTASKVPANQQNQANKPQSNSAALKPHQNSTNQPNKPQQNQANKPQQNSTNQANKPQQNQPNKPQQNQANKPQQNSTNQANKPQQNQANKPQQNSTNQANKPQQNQVNKPQQNQANKPQQNSTNQANKPQQNQVNKPQQNQANKPQQNQVNKPQQNQVNKPQQNSTTTSNKPPQTSSTPSRPPQKPIPVRQQSSSTLQRQQVSQTPSKPQARQAPSSVNSKQPPQKPAQNQEQKRQIQPPLRQVSTAQKVPLRGQNMKNGGAKGQTNATGQQSIRKNVAGVKSNSVFVSTGNAKLANHTNPPQKK